MLFQEEEAATHRSMHFSELRGILLLRVRDSLRHGVRECRLMWQLRSEMNSAARQSSESKKHRILRTLSFAKLGSPGAGLWSAATSLAEN